MTSQVNSFSIYKIIMYLPWVFLISLAVVFAVLVYPNVVSNIETRENNYKLIDNSLSCTELENNYLKAIDFESSFFDNGESVKVNAHEHAKALELSCK